MSLKIYDAPALQKSGEPSSPIGQAANRRNAVDKEALSCLPSVDLGELCQQWRGLYKEPGAAAMRARPELKPGTRLQTQAPQHFGRELLERAVAYRMHELDLGGLRPEPRRQLLRIAQQFARMAGSNL
jgi:hypothetical protein